MSKEFVAMEKRICLVCAKPYETGAVLLNGRMQPIPENHYSGWGMCPEHDQLFQSGFVALVGADETRSDMHGKERVDDPSSVYRTGRLAFVQRSVWNRLFNIPAPDCGVCYAPDQVLDFVERLHNDRVAALPKDDGSTLH